jgi:glycosyltransferase involved in cell wall biosynthesis
MNRLKIAQVSPLFESVPPKQYGGTERIIAYLTEALVDQGHEVTLFASGDSGTRAHLVPTRSRALRLDPGTRGDWLPDHILQLERVLAHAEEFDVIHFHIDLIHLPAVRRLGVPHLTTLHGRLDLPDLPGLYREFTDVPLVSISNAQRAPLDWVNWVATVGHGLPVDLYSPHPGGGGGGYLAFLGRISPEKGPDRAIAIAKAAGLPLKIAAKIDAVDRQYFESVVRPLLDHPLIDFVGEVGDREKQEFLGNALALIFPIDWPEPFGLVMIESLACGTPVIAYRRGSVEEVMSDGKTGFIVNGFEEAVQAVRHIDQIDRSTCRRVFDWRFTAPRMAYDYLDVYSELIAQHRAASRHESGIAAAAPRARRSS